MIRKMRIILLGVTPIKYPNLPLTFARSGYVNLSSGIVDYVGNSLYGWSRVARSATVAYYLGVNPSEVYPSHYYGRWRGSPSAASTQVVPNGGKKIDTGYIFPLQNRAHLFSRPPNWKNFIQLTSQNSFIPRYASSRSSCVIPR